MKVGDYVRTECGTISKIKKLFEKEDYIFLDVNNNVSGKQNIIKSSPNLIDLIEVGDILMIKDMFGNVSKVEVDEDFKLLSGTIISIVTKEQFESMEYKVGE